MGLLELDVNLTEEQKTIRPRGQEILQRGVETRRHQAGQDAGPRRRHR